MTSALDQALSQVFLNGEGEAGLEIGADPGLTTNDYIQVPDCLIKPWAIKLCQESYDKVKDAADPAKPRAWVRGSSPLDYVGLPGWCTSGDIYFSEGTPHVQVGDDWLEAEDFHIVPHTGDDLRAFITVNIGHISDAEFDEATQMWIHACRFWAVASGFVHSSKSTEFVRVANPTSFANAAILEPMVQYVVDFRDNAWTASAARASSWRKSNHATGGDTLTGFPLRWARKMGFIPPTQDRAQAAAQLRRVTRAFYTATHASSVHAVLGLMANDDENAWAIINPEFGLVDNWTIHPSVAVRMVPNTQIAGAALVADSIAVLRMTIAEGIAPLIGALDQLSALMAAYETVKENGMRCAIYAKWFFANCPSNIAPVAFNQKDPSFADLVGELAIIATRYYSSSTIAGSASLQNAAEQSPNEDAKATWAAIAAQRRRVSGAQAVRAVARIKGAAASDVVIKLLADDPDIIRTGIAEFNSALAGLASTVGSVTAPQINADQILVNAGLAARGEADDDAA